MTFLSSPAGSGAGSKKDGDCGKGDDASRGRKTVIKPSIPSGMARAKAIGDAGRRIEDFCATWP